jgi:hypothetical protein
MRRSCAAPTPKRTRKRKRKERKKFSLAKIIGGESEKEKVAHLLILRSFTLAV